MNKAELNKKLAWAVQLNKLQDVKEALTDGADPNCCGHLCLAWAMYNYARQTPNSDAAKQIILLLIEHGARLDDKTFEAYYANLVEKPQLELLEALKELTPPKYFDDALCRICEHYLSWGGYFDKNGEKKKLIINVINFLLDNDANPQNPNSLKVLEQLGIGVFAL